MNKICYLVCAGDKTKLDFTPTANDLVIAVDGGYKYLTGAKIKPNLAVGDFDSLGYIPKMAETIVLNPIKDDTDTFAAINEGLKRGYRHFEIYAAMGGRVSHSIANIQTASYLNDNDCTVFIRGDGYYLTVRSEGIMTFEKGGYVSLISLTDTAFVTLDGFKYSGDVHLSRKDTLGISNEPKENAVMKIHNGEVLIIVEKTIR